jgi:hypothetical protein
VVILVAQMAEVIREKGLDPNADTTTLAASPTVTGAL